MSGLVRCIGLILVLAAQVSWAQNPADISFTLSTKGGKTSFRQGEAIGVELRFQSDIPGKYQVITDPSQRVHLNGFRVYDQFTGEPAEYAMDPLREQTRMGEMVTGPPPRLAPVTSSPVVVEQVMNDWISFRKVGRYRITAQTKRVSLVDRSQNPARVFMPTPLPVRSNTIDIDIVAPEPDWADEQLQLAVASVNGPPAVVGRSFDMKREQEIADSARVLRFLETREAAVALVRFFERYPDIGNIVAGLYGSPYRDEVISALKEGITSPDLPVTSNWIDALSELTTAQALGPCPPFAKEGPLLQAWLDRFRAEMNRYMDMLSGAIARKQGQARAVSLDVLSRRNGAAPPAADAIAAVLETFYDLPESTQQRYLTMDWYRIASPEILPMIKFLAEGTGPLRDTALARLQEVDPDAARPTVLNRIRKGDILNGAYRDPRVLMLLPDRVLPEMDQVLVDMLHQGKPIGTLVCRYVSDAMFGRIQVWVEAHPYSVCNPINPILPYFFRVDPDYAVDLLARIRKSQQGNCDLAASFSADPFLSPGLERAAIADLASDNSSVQRSALTALAFGGSAAAEQPIWDGLARLRASGKDPTDGGLEYGYMDALTRGMGWVMTPDKLERLAAACITDSCRQNIEAMRRHSAGPIAISISGMPNVTSVRIDLFEVFSSRQLEAKIRQFPPGTRFYFPAMYKGVWYYEQRMSQIRPILEAAGMQIVDQPAR